MKMLSLLKKANDVKNGSKELDSVEEEIFAYALDLYERIVKGKDNTKLGAMQDIEAISECVIYLMSKQISRSL